MITRKKNLVVRADSNSAIGAGHVMRCIALAHAWQDIDGDVTFVCKEMPAELRKRLRSEGFGVIKSLGRIGSLTDALSLLKIADQTFASAIVIDGYQFGQRYHDLISNQFANTLIVDDLGQLSFYLAKFVLNQNLNACETYYQQRNEDTNLLLGTKFALVRRELLQHPSRIRARDGSIKHVVLSLGGTDPGNITHLLIQSLKRLSSQNIRFRVLAGFGSERHKHLLEVAANDRRFEVLPSTLNMGDHYSWADLAISAGGSSNWEMSCFALPRIVLTTASNQLGAVEAMHECGTAICLGWIDDHNIGTVNECVETLLDNPSLCRTLGERSLTVVDGKGSARVVEELREA